MRPLSLSPDLECVARNTVWFKEPAAALADPVHFIAHVLTYGTHDDVQVLRRHITDADLRYAIEHAPPGVFDPRSWTYWNQRFGRWPSPGLPVRKLP